MEDYTCSFVWTSVGTLNSPRRWLTFWTIACGGELCVTHLGLVGCTLDTGLMLVCMVSSLDTHLCYLAVVAQWKFRMVCNLNPPQSQNDRLLDAGPLQMLRS